MLVPVQGMMWGSKKEVSFVLMSRHNFGILTANVVTSLLKAVAVTIQSFHLPGTMNSPKDQLQVYSFGS